MTCRTLCLCSLLLLAGCRSAKQEPLTIFAAASTHKAVEEIAHDFQAETATKVVVSPGPSSNLARQIEQGAGADLFLSADEEWADYLSERGLVEHRRDLLGNRLVVVTPSDSPLTLHDLNELPNLKFQHLALAGAAVPAGKYARQALQKAGVLTQVEGRVIVGGDVTATLTYVVRGEAEVGFVYATDAAASDRVRVALVVPESLHRPIRYPLVRIRRDTPHPASKAFADYLAGPKAEAVFRRAGFAIIPTNDPS
jgi:molybdate transport system substrate-binding protein